MTGFLIRSFLKSDDGSVDHGDAGRLAGIVGIVCNVLLTAAKMVSGIISGSVSVVADAVNNLSDAASSVVTLVGFRLAQRPADSDHPFGHARYEYLSGTVVAAFIIVIGVELFKTSVEKILHPQPFEATLVTVAVLTVSIILKLWLSHFYRTLGKMISSQTLLASAADSRNDVLSTAVVLVGCAVSFLFHVNIDGWIGLAVAAFIVWSGIGIAKDAVSPLLGRRAEQSTIDAIEHIILSQEKVLGAHDLLVHDYGPGQCYASVHVELNADDDAMFCHNIIDGIEREVLAQTNVHLVVHYDPVVIDDEEQNEMTKTVDDIIHAIDGRFSMHDFRIVRGAGKNKLVFDLSVPFSMLDDHDDIKRRIDDALSRMGKNYVTVIRFDGK